ncbi:MAG: hypothetical protein IJ339_00305 [Oscillospiraceae bacterium]|nr:hypothetical protein [Oscillospiraceae bacterium]
MAKTMKLHKLSRQAAFDLGREVGKAEGRQCGFDTALYLALAGYYNTKPDDIVSDEEFGLWSIKAEEEVTRIFNEDVKGDFDVSKQAVVVDETKETVDDSVKFTLHKLNKLRKELKMRQFDEV